MIQMRIEDIEAMTDAMKKVIESMEGAKFLLNLLTTENQAVRDRAKRYRTTRNRLREKLKRMSEVAKKIKTKRNKGEECV